MSTEPSSTDCHLKRVEEKFFPYAIIVYTLHTYCRLRLVHKFYVKTYRENVYRLTSCLIRSLIVSFAGELCARVCVYVASTVVAVAVVVFLLNCNYSFMMLLLMIAVKIKRSYFCFQFPHILIHAHCTCAGVICCTLYFRINITSFLLYAHLTTWMQCVWHSIYSIAEWTAL